jgi:hypothetical protein
MIKKPKRLRHLLEDHRGFVIPWFVQWFSAPGVGAPYGMGTHDFRVADHTKFARALKEKRCWICGDKLGVHMAFVIGPMCAVNEVTSEPPCHFECAEYAVQVCPFLSKPRMRRNERALPEVAPVAGVHIARNPGAACIWVTKSYKTFRPHQGADGVLMHLGPAERVLWFCEGRAATRAEIEAAISSGLPALAEVAELQGGDAPLELAAGLQRVQALLPA